jgi:uncharacterized protein YkwD
MNWWVIFQTVHWLLKVNSPPASAVLSDEVFFAQTTSQQPIVLEKPDTLLLDVALFQATNEARRIAGLTLLQYDRALYLAARNHAASMMRHNYTSHEDFYELADLTLLRRVQKQTNRFGRLAENIGQYQTIDTPDWYGVRFNARRQQYEYVNAETKLLYKPYSYASFVRYAVIQLLNSPHHRANLLNPHFTHVGCAVRLSANPYKQRQAPFGRIVQNFGAQRSSSP